MYMYSGSGKPSKVVQFLVHMLTRIKHIKHDLLERISLQCLVYESN
jgi:hypothetical protein